MLKNKCCLYVIISIRFFSVSICNVLIEFPSYIADFVFMLDPTNASCICGIKVIFSIMNLYLFLKCMPSDLKSLSSLWFDMRSICYLLCKSAHSYRSGIVNATNKKLQVCVFGRNLYDSDETNSILEIKLTLYCQIFEEISPVFLNVADFFKSSCSDTSHFEVGLILYFLQCSYKNDRLCGLVVRVSGYRYRCLGFDSRRYQIF